MSENPYQAPLNDPEKTTFENPIALDSKVSVKPPAICLIVVSVISILFLLFALVAKTVLVASEIEPTGDANFQSFISVVKTCE